MNEIQIFNNPEFGQIGMIEFNGKPHAVGNNVAGMLEYARPHEAVTAHCKGAVTCRLLTEGGMQDVKIIPEGDIYRLIVKAADQSKNPNIREKAEKIEKWIFDEVVPSIRKTGKYETLPEVTDEHLKIAYTLINTLDRPNLGKGAQKEIGKAIANAIKLSGRENKKQKAITTPVPVAPNTNPTPSDLLTELLSYAVPVSTFRPRSLTELRSSILYDHNFYYIFPWAAERHIKLPEAKKIIYKEVRFLDGKSKNKHLIFSNINRRTFHVWILPRQAVMLSPRLPLICPSLCPTNRE